MFFRLYPNTAYNESACVNKRLRFYPDPNNRILGTEQKNERLAQSGNRNRLRRFLATGWKHLVHGSGVLKILIVGVGPHQRKRLENDFKFFIHLERERDFGLIAVTSLNRLTKFARGFTAECLFDRFGDCDTPRILHEHRGPRNGLDDQQVPARDRKHRRKQQGISYQFRHRNHAIREKPTHRQGKLSPRLTCPNR